MDTNSHVAERRFPAAVGRPQVPFVLGLISAGLAVGSIPVGMAVAGSWGPLLGVIAGAGMLLAAIALRSFAVAIAKLFYGQPHPPAFR